MGLGSGRRRDRKSHDDAHARKDLAQRSVSGSARPGIAWPLTVLTFTSDTTDRVGRRFTLNNVVSSADQVLATHTRERGRDPDEEFQHQGAEVHSASTGGLRGHGTRSGERRTRVSGAPVSARSPAPAAPARCRSRRNHTFSYFFGG